MPAAVKSLHLWIAVAALTLTGLAAAALGAEAALPVARAWSTLAAI